MADLGTILLSAVVSVAQGSAAKEPERLRSIADDIAAVVTSADRDVFRGEGADIATGLMLVAIAKHESEFHAKVDDCTRRGDVGRSITIFQILRGPNWAGHDARTICADRRLAATLALALLARPVENRPHLTPQMIANAYATGAPGVTNRASRDICKIWERLAREARLERAVCGAAREYAAPRS